MQSFKEFKTELEALKKVQIPSASSTTGEAAGKGQPTQTKKEVSKSGPSTETLKTIEVLEGKVNEAVNFLTQFKEYNQKFQRVISESQKDVWTQINEIKSKRSLNFDIVASRGTRGKSARSTSMPRDLLRSNANGGNDPDESLISNNTIRRDDDESREEKPEFKEQTPPRNKLPAQLPKKPVGPPILNKPGLPFRPSQAVEAQMNAEEEAKAQATLDTKLTSAPTSAAKPANLGSNEGPGPLPAALPRPGPPALARGAPKPNAFAKRPPAPTPAAPQPAQDLPEEGTPNQQDPEPVLEQPAAPQKEPEEQVPQPSPAQQEAPEQTPQPQPVDQEATQETQPLGEADDDESRPKTGFGLAAPKPVFRPPARPAGPPGARPGGAPARPAGPPPRPGGAPVPRKPPM